MQGFVAYRNCETLLHRNLKIKFFTKELSQTTVISDYN